MGQTWMKTLKSKSALRLAPPNTAGFVLFEVAFLVAYWLGMSFSQRGAAPFWFPDSVLLCGLLMSPPSTWWMFIVGIAPIRLFLFVPPEAPFWAMVGFLANDAMKGLVSAWLLRRVSRPALWLESFREYLW